MTDPTTTQVLEALVKRTGASSVAISLLRRYWKPVGGTLSVAVSVGILIQQGRDAKVELEAIKTAQQAQVTQNAAVNDRLTKLEAAWGALFGAAHINVVPNTPPAPAPAEARKGRVRR